jgi:hypothetical protein
MARYRPWQDARPVASTGTCVRGLTDRDGPPRDDNRTDTARLGSASPPRNRPPGRLRLATSPTSTGSLPVRKTIGIVVVAALAACTDGVVVAAISVTCRRTRSAANSGRRSFAAHGPRTGQATRCRGNRSPASREAGNRKADRRTAAAMGRVQIPTLSIDNVMRLGARRPFRNMWSVPVGPRN